VPRACLPSLIADRRTREGRGRSARTGPPIPRNFPLRARRHSRRRFRAQPPRTRRQMDCRHIRARNGGSAGGVGHRTHRVDKVSNSASTAPISPMGPMPDTSMPLLSAHRASGLRQGGRRRRRPRGLLSHPETWVVKPAPSVSLFRSCLNEIGRSARRSFCQRSIW
jgi:hypothetical protein